MLELLMILFAVGCGIVIGRYIGKVKERKRLVAYQNENPPVSEETVYLILENMGYKPSKEQIKTMMANPSAQMMIQSQIQQNI